MKNARIWSILAGTIMLWIAVPIVLVYDHGVQLGNPDLTAVQRQAHADWLYAIAGVFLAFNAVMTVLRVRMAIREERRGPKDSGRSRIDS